MTAIDVIIGSSGLISDPMYSAETRALSVAL